MDVTPYTTVRGNIREQSIDMDSALSPLQKQATQTQRLLGTIEEKLEKALAELKDHENRIVRLENKATTSENLHKTGK